MISNIIFFTLGTAVSLIISIYFYRRSSREKPNWYSPDKELESIRKILEAHPEDLNWTASKILALYKQKIMGIASADSISWGVCPECGSNSIKHHEFIDDKHDDVYRTTECKDCGWSSQ